MKDIRKAVRREHKEFIETLHRGRELYAQISGGKLLMGNQLRGLRAPNKRDMAQLLFFDVASQWEAFCTSVFELELKKLYHVQTEVAARMMSVVDGRVPVSGYANPQVIVGRAEVLLGKRSPWVTLQTALGNQIYNYLLNSYRVRNFIAHAGVGKGRDDFHKVVRGAGIPVRQRKGLSAGRFLLDYNPRGAQKNWFDTLLDNHEQVADYILKKLG